MPDYRDDYRRPPRRANERSAGRNRNHGGQPSGYDVGRRPARRDEYFDDREHRRSERQGRSASQGGDPFDQEYRPRTARRERAGEYLSDVGEDRYESFGGMDEAQRYEQTVSVNVFDAEAADEFDAADGAYANTGGGSSDGFNDPDSIDENDEWFASRRYRREEESEALKEEPAVPAPVNTRGWSEQNGFDGFEDDEDVQRVVRANPRRADNDGWYEDDAYYGRGVKSPRKPVNVPEKRGAAKSRFYLVPVIGLLALAVIAVSTVLIFGGSDDTSIPLDSVVDAMTVSQTDTLVGCFIDKSLADTVCNVRVDSNSGTLVLSDCEITYIGKGADRSSRYVTGTNPETGELERIEYAVSGTLRYNKTALRAFLDSLVDEGGTPVVDPYFEIDYENSTMTVYGGSDGWGVDVEKFLSQLCSGLAASGGGNITVTCTSGNVAARKLTAEDIYNQAATKAVDAYTTTDSSGQTIYHSEINGVDFSRSELERAMAAGGDQWQIPVSVTFPKINIKDIRKYTFPDVLASYYTYYSPEDVNRSHNLALAAEHINSIILEPGEQFSFNDRVGQRTAANGFRKAGVYAGEGNSEDYGGGICQTSSTLYYTCVLANLQIDERRNHMYTVGYMTTTSRQRVYGNDATVNWGTTDYKFTNSKEYPIRIDFVAKGGVLTCEIRGTADGYTADLEFETLSSTPYKIKYLKMDGTKDQSGKPGYKVDVYRVIYKDGVKVDRKHESTNTYQPMNQVYYTNEIPVGFEYGVEYEQGYTPSTETTTAPPPAEMTTTTLAPPPEDPVLPGPDDGVVG
ncbi:MAG: hypothetical protein E7554_01065 [Ruminococcaceae bacterium]|nr:hypothetical protein [Oscillospiraceae bacterium]